MDLQNLSLSSLYLFIGEKMSLIQYAIEKGISTIITLILAFVFVIVAFSLMSEVGKAALQAFLNSPLSIIGIATIVILFGILVKDLLRSFYNN